MDAPHFIGGGVDGSGASVEDPFTDPMGGGTETDGGETASDDGQDEYGDEGYDQQGDATATASVRARLVRERKSACVLH